MGGKAACWIDQLKLQREVPALFPDFGCMLIDQYAPLDNKNVAQDKLQELWYLGAIQQYIT